MMGISVGINTGKIVKSLQWVEELNDVEGLSSNC